MARTAGSTAEHTRERILQVAMNLFSRRGYAATSLRDIADDLAMTKSAVYYHFASKENLLDAILAPLVNGLGELGERTARARADLDESDAVAVAAFKTDTIRRLVDLQIVNVPLMRSLMFDPSATRELQGRKQFFDGFAGTFERAFAGTADAGIVMRHRSAIGSINGALILTANATLRENPQITPQELTEATREHAEVLVSSALAILGIVAAAGSDPAPTESPPRS